jgi:ribulose-5-phosphate 4-epimerase/fuculose-1-phosphate aldolase
LSSVSGTAGAGAQTLPARAGAYALAGSAAGSLAVFARELGVALEAAGFVFTDDPAGAGLVLNLIDAEQPKPFRRKSRGTFVAALYVQDEEPEDGLRQSYPLLVRALANVVLCYVPSQGVSFTTMERGHYRVDENGDGRTLAEAVADRLLPLARSRLVIENEFRTDLEPELWSGDELTEQISAASRRLDRLGLLPAPFPIEELLDERDLRHVARLYGIGGLSYGNLSARKDEQRFWMSASGVDKSHLEEPGRDILLVSGYDSENARMVLAVPPNIEPRRVSVDAIEHWTIYQRHPDVDAILHVHAWMDGIAATDINYPCGTAELAEAVSAVLAAEPDPAHAVIGLRNHGITATGESLGEILDRIEPSLLRQVPMT